MFHKEANGAWQPFVERHLHPSHIPHPTSHIPHPTSNISHPTSHIPYPHPNMILSPLFFSQSELERALDLVSPTRSLTPPPTYHQQPLCPPTYYTITSHYKSGPMSTNTFAYTYTYTPSPTRPKITFACPCPSFPFIVCFGPCFLLFPLPFPPPSSRDCCPPSLPFLSFPFLPFTPLALSLPFGSSYGAFKWTLLCVFFFGGLPHPSLHCLA